MRMSCALSALLAVASGCQVPTLIASPADDRAIAIALFEQVRAAARLPLGTRDSCLPDSAGLDHLLNDISGQADEAIRSVELLQGGVPGYRYFRLRVLGKERELQLVIRAIGGSCVDYKMAEIVV